MMHRRTKHTCALRAEEVLGLKRSPFHQSPVGQPDAVLPQDVGHGQRDAHVAGDVAQPPVKLLKLLRTKKDTSCLG